MKRSVKLDISWRAWSLIVGFFILVGFVGFSIATTNPNIMGHPYGDLGIPGCSAGKFLTYNSSGSLVCGDALTAVNWSKCKVCLYYQNNNGDIRYDCNIVTHSTPTAINAIKPTEPINSNDYLGVYMVCTG
ncbi:MAG: hypothetical protein WCI72_05195 [archaeon]